MEDTLEVLSCLEQNPLDFESQQPINPEYEFLAGMISDADKFFKSQSVHEQERTALQENISSLRVILNETQQSLTREREMRLQCEANLKSQVELNEELNDTLVNAKLQQDQSIALAEENFYKQSESMVELLQEVVSAYLVQYEFLRHRRVFKHKVRLNWPLLNNKIEANEFLRDIYSEHLRRELTNPPMQLKDASTSCSDIFLVKTTSTGMNTTQMLSRDSETNTDEVDSTMGERVHPPRQTVEMGMNTVAPNRVTRSTQVTEKKHKTCDRSTMCSILEASQPQLPPSPPEESMDLDEIFSTTICKMPAILDEIEELVIPKVSASCQTDTADVDVSITATGSLTELCNISRSIDYVTQRKRTGRDDPELVKRELSTEMDLLNRQGVDGISNQFEQYWTLAGRSLLAMLETKPKNEAVEVDIFTGALFHQQISKILRDAPVRRAVSIPSVYAESTKSGYEKDAADDDDQMDGPNGDYRVNSEDSMEPPLRSFRRITEDFMRETAETRPSSTELPSLIPPPESPESQETAEVVENRSEQINSTTCRKSERKMKINRTVSRILRDRTTRYKLKRPMERIQSRLAPKPVVPAKRTRREKPHKESKSHNNDKLEKLNAILFGSDEDEEKSSRIGSPNSKLTVENEPGDMEKGIEKSNEETREEDQRELKSIVTKRKQLNAVLFGSDSEPEDDDTEMPRKAKANQESDEPEVIAARRKELLDNLLFESDSEDEESGKGSYQEPEVREMQNKDQEMETELIDPPIHPTDGGNAILETIAEETRELTQIEVDLPIDFDSPKSPPPFDSVSTEDHPKEIPTQTVIQQNTSGCMRELKLTHTTINQFLQNYTHKKKPVGCPIKTKKQFTEIINAYLDREWTSDSVDQCVNSLKEIMGDNPNMNGFLIKCMLTIIAPSTDDLHYEPFNCLAPHMPQTHQMIVLLVTRFNLGKLMIKEIERSLFTFAETVPLASIVNWTYLYLTLQDLEINVRRPGDKIPLRLFMAKAFYYLKYTSVIIAYMTLKAFPKLLPRMAESQSFVIGKHRDPLVDVLICLLMNPIATQSRNDTQSKTDEIRNSLQKLVRTYYRYPQFQIKPLEVVATLMDRLRTPGRGLNVVHGFLILGKHFNVDWAMNEILHKAIQPHTELLMNVGDGALSAEAEHELCLCLTVISGVIKVFPRESNVCSYRDVFRKVLDNQQKYSQRLQECAVTAIIRLTAFSTDEAFKAIRDWYSPIQDISPHLRAVLESFVRRRPPAYWIQLSNEV